MYATITSAAVALLAFASLGRAGTASVTNNCDFPVYLWSVSSNVGGMQTLESGSGSYSEGYQINPDGGGVAIKISNETSQEIVTQLEYTLDAEMVFYDLSNINGYPFMQEGVQLNPSVGSCTSLTCAAGVQDCVGAYNTPEENEATNGCESSCDLTLTLCPGSSKRAVEVETRQAHSHAHRRHVPPQGRRHARL